jgi:hypothetical protein
MIEIYFKNEFYDWKSVAIGMHQAAFGANSRARASQAWAAWDR